MATDRRWIACLAVGLLFWLSIHLPVCPFIWLAAYIHVFVCLFPCLSAWPFVCPCNCNPVCMSACLPAHRSVACLLAPISACLSLHLSSCLSTCLRPCLPVCPSIYLLFCLSVGLFVCGTCMSACLSVRLYVCLFVHPFACQYVCLPSCWPAMFCLPVGLPVCLFVYPAGRLFLENSRCFFGVRQTKCKFLKSELILFVLQMRDDVSVDTLAMGTRKQIFAPTAYCKKQLCAVKKLNAQQIILSRPLLKEFKTVN